MRQISVKEFEYSDLPNLLREMADWLEEQGDFKVWNLVFEPNEDPDSEETQWAGYCFGIQTKHTEQPH